MPTVPNIPAVTTPRARPRAGFTLFEIAISLVLALIGVLSVAMLMPAGIKAEQLSRMRIYAGVKAEEMIEVFANASSNNPCMDTEAPDMWEVPAGYRVMAPDLEARISTPRFGIMPLPDVIARRLASDEGEIEGILAQGGKLYYAQAQQTTGLNDDVELASKNLANDNRTQKLVFAVTGYAQNNNLAHLAWKDWPYYEPYPSPPGHGERNGHNPSSPPLPPSPEHLPSDAVSFIFPSTFIVNTSSSWINLWEGVGANGPDAGPMDGHGGSIDADISTVFTVGYKPYGLVDLLNDSTQGNAMTYLQSTLWYCQRKGVPAAVYLPGSGFTVDAQVASAMTSFNALPEGLKWSWVQSLRFLSHASTCMTRWYVLVDLGGQPSTGGLPVPAAVIKNGSANSPAITLSHDLIVYWHELSMRMVMTYAASQPYDWGAPRATQRPIMMDYPLIECDLLSPPLDGTISGSGGLKARQWRPLPAHPIANPGRSYSYPDMPIDPGGTRFSSDPANFTLAKPFKASERCRQLVFWMADWQSYEDAETAPSAAIDASKYLFAAPIDLNSGTAPFATRMQSCDWPDHHVYQFRNPEKNITFTVPVAGLPTGSDTSTLRMPDYSGASPGCDRYDGSVASSERFLGLYGADRNFSGTLDRGTVPPSVRLRATLVARYNFYDPRLTLKLK